MLTDSHAHFDSFVESNTVAEVVSAAAFAGVTRMVAIGGSPAANRRAVDLAAAYPGVIWASVGCDRDLAGQPVPRAQLEEWLRLPNVVAVGETGLDYHYEPQAAAGQKVLFADMLTLAAETSRAVVIHSREADADTLALLRAHLGPAGGVLHCFTGSAEFACALLDLGLFIGISGIATFKKSEALRDIARFVPADRLLVETDSPYLAPVPHRGKPNQPAYVRLVAETLASVRGVTLETLAEQTSSNADRLFHFSRRLA